MLGEDWESTGNQLIHKTESEEKSTDRAICLVCLWVLRVICFCLKCLYVKFSLRFNQWIIGKALDRMRAWNPIVLETFYMGILLQMF